jgi:hypothetical protein
VRALDKGAVEQAWTKAGILDRCRATTAGLQGLHCRLLALTAAPTPTPQSPADVDAQAVLIGDVLGAGAFVDRWVPTAPEPGLRRLKLDVHKVACARAFAGIGVLDGVPPSHAARARARAVIEAAPGSPGLRARACDCARRSAEMAVAADAPADEHAALQGEVTRQRCNVGDAARMAERRDPERGFDAGAAETRAAAATSTPAGRLVELARGRALDLGRCTDKHVTPEGRVREPEKLTSCACGVVKRWALPTKKSDPRVEARLPLQGEVVLPVVVEGGQLSSCGPVAGATP